MSKNKITIINTKDINTTNANMLKIIEFIFETIWHFLGFVILFELFLEFILKIYRQLNIRKHGYPPSHCDVDGNFKDDFIEDDE